MQAFQKGSPIAADVSAAILTISEDGTLKGLEEKWFPRSAQCSNNEIGEVSLGNFWALYLICAAISTLCFLLFLLHLLKDFRRLHRGTRCDDANENVWMKTLQLVNFFYPAKTEIPTQRQPNMECRTAQWSRMRRLESPPDSAATNSRVHPSDVL